MNDQVQLQNLNLSLVSDDESMVSVVRIACPPPHQVARYPFENLVTESNKLSETGRDIVASIAKTDAVLVGWDMRHAPFINTLAHHIHKASLTPVIALCGGNPDEQVSALAAGADATLTFPLYLPLLQMEIASFRRTFTAAYMHGMSQGGLQLAEENHRQAQNAVRQFGKLRLDPNSRRFYIESTSVPLTAKEFRLLSYLVENAGLACSRDEILETVWGINFDTGTNMVDVYMYFLRKKLAAYGLNGMIETVRSYGYRLSLDEIQSREVAPANL